MMFLSFHQLDYFMMNKSKMLLMERVTFWKGDNMTFKDDKVDFKELLNHKITIPYTVKEINKPDLDKMAEVFYKLLRP